MGGKYKKTGAASTPVSKGGYIVYFRPGGAVKAKKVLPPVLLNLAPR